ncbi:MAG: hypothetical protein IIZ93_15040 [Acidaminococcaceae bacterium]|nr:hypothetical protein [Acidaminococcaceae bacterium]
MEYLKIWVSFAEIIEPLNDSERGRLFTAMLLYADCGQLPDFKGNERYIWPMAKQAIDRTRAESDKQTANGSMGGRPRKKPEKPTESQQNPEKPTESLKDKDKEKENNKVIVKDAREELPFGLTEEEIHSSLTRDSQIEDAARSAGLNTSETAMLKARDYAQQYGLDTLLDAIRKTPLQAQKPSWAYVEGILKGGNGNDNRGNHSGVSGNGGTSGKYSHLFT